MTASKYKNIEEAGVAAVDDHALSLIQHCSVMLAWHSPACFEVASSRFPAHPILDTLPASSFKAVAVNVLGTPVPSQLLA